MSEPCKLAVQSWSGFTISGIGFFRCSIKSKIHTLAIGNDSCLPAPSVSSNTLKPRATVGSHFRILHILGMCRRTQVGETIVQSVSVNVVAFTRIAVLNSEDYSVHLNHTTFFSSLGVERSSFRTPAGVPFPAHQPLIANSIHDCKLSLRKRNQTIGCVRAGFLSDQVHGRLR